MLIGEPPFTGRTAQMIVKRQQIEPPRPLRTVRPTIPPALERAVLRSLAKVPADRFPTAGAFAAALASIPLEDAGESVAPPNSVAVLPFNDESEHHDLEYFCDGMTDAVITALSGVSTLRVPPGRSVHSFKGKRHDIQRIGRALNVRTVLEGSVRTAEDRLRIAVSLTDATDGFQRWSESYDRSMTDLFVVQDEIAQSIVGALQIALSGERGSPLVAPPTANVEAYRLYLQGRHYWNRRFEGGLQKAIDCFQGALERDPLYARAYSGLADCFLALCTYEFLAPKDGLPRATAAVRRALELDNGIAEAHASRGLVCMYHHEWAEAEQSIKRSIDLDPDYATVHQFYSMWLAGHRDMKGALAEIDRARELDPLSPILSAAVGWNLYFHGRYGEAVEALRSTLQVHPTFSVARGMLGQAFVELGEFEDGIRELKETALTFPPAVGALGYAYGAAGRIEEAREILQQLERRARVTYMSPYGPAIVYAGLGERDAAFEWLEKAYEARSFYMILVPVNPMFNRIKDDPRFEALLRKMSLR
jgi:TolB-like protein/Tfp pilus assembly protein PilF